MLHKVMMIIINAVADDGCAAALPDAALQDGGAVEAAGLPRKPRLLSPLSAYASPERTAQAVCIELVGSRFLRRMVRILCATALREAAFEYPHEAYSSNPDQLPLQRKQPRNENLLVELCKCGDRCGVNIRQNDTCCCMRYCFCCFYYIGCYCYFYCYCY